MNKVILRGRVGKEPEVRYLPNGTVVASLSLATTSRFKGKDGSKQERTEWHNLVVYGKLGEVIQKYVGKGKDLLVEGEIRYESYEKDGQKRYITKIHVSGLEMLGGSKPSGEGQSAGQGHTEETQMSDADFSNISDADLEDIPF